MIMRWRMFRANFAALCRLAYGRMCARDDNPPAIGEQDKRSSETATLARQADDVRLKAERVLRADYMLH